MKKTKIFLSSGQQKLGTTGLGTARAQALDYDYGSGKYLNNT